MLWGVFAIGWVCFGWKSFPEMLFQTWGCVVGPENSIFRKLKSVDSKNQPLTTEMLLHFYFPFKAFPENERERESTCAHERGEDPGAIASSSSSPRSRAPVWAPAPVRGAIAISRRRRDRDRAVIAIRDRNCTVIAIRDRDRAVDRDRAIDRDRRSRSRRDRRWWFYVFSGLWLVFSDLCFPSSFPNTKHQKIFFGKFFKMQPNTWKYFPFPEISIFGKYVFSGKRFTATKHSLKCYGGVWFVFSNNHFQFLNNISRISTHFFTHTYFHKCF